MTTEAKRTKILAAAASFGHHADIYPDLCREMAREGLISMRETFTKVGARVNRWFLA